MSLYEEYYPALPLFEAPQVRSALACRLGIVTGGVNLALKPHQICHLPFLNLENKPLLKQ